MDIQNDAPFLYFNFINSEGKIKPLIFTNPEKIIVAWTMSDVLKGMEDVQQAVDNGYYAAGYVSYEAAPAFNSRFIVNKGNTMPLLWFGIFEKPITKISTSMKPFSFNKWQPTVSIENYNTNVNKILNYINNGITKQVNYTIQMASEFEGDSFSFYKQLEEAQSADYTAYLNIGDYSILSASPELFFQINEGEITVKPMKGTVNRGLTYEDDVRNAKWLKNSNKNKAENKMIVNLMKSDLEKIAIKDTIKVPKLYEIEKYPTVYQMTSTVTAKVSEEKSVIDVFKALFPCGSITGLPKEETMEIIRELESTPREVYCGTVGYITPEKNAIFNVPIRTAMINNDTGQALYGVGGAITKDSTKEEEYEEVITKTKLLTRKNKSFQLLETLRLFNGEYFLLEHHLKRLEQSAIYFNYNIKLDSINKALAINAEKYNEKKWIVRLLAHEDGEFSIETNKLHPNKENNFITLAEQPIQKEDLFLYHKTTNRGIYEIHQNKHIYDVLLWNENNEVTEFTTGNLVVKLNGNLVTPPIKCGLLPGTFRSTLIEDGTITEQKILKSDLDTCEEIWFINSVRRWIRVYLQS